MTGPAHVSARYGDALGSLARHNHVEGHEGGGLPSLHEVLACPNCNPNQYARHHSTHRKATP